ncbi:MAG: diaminopimelate decarboxylase [Tunicatimonas sp.]
MPTTSAPASAPTVQGVNLLEISQTFGTPLYVYDSEKITSQIDILKQAFNDSRVRFKYAAKALTNQAILKLIKQQGIGLDVVSIEEARLGLLAGFGPEQVMYTPSGVAFEEIVAGVELGVQINIDNLPLLQQFGEKYGSEVPCCLRFNPNVMAGGNSKISVGHSYSKFGIPFAQLESILSIVEKHQIHVNGVHIHTGSDIGNGDAFLQGAERLLDAARRFDRLDFIDLGSGFKVPYQAGDPSTDLEELGRRLLPIFNAFAQQYNRPLTVWFEPGKFIVSASGQLLARVNVVKENPNVTFVGIDTGLNHLIRPMMYDAYHTIENLSNPKGVLKTYTVVGYICETDTFATDRTLPEVRPGDVLAIKNAGAYGYSMASNYNGRPRPAEVLIHRGEAKLIRQRESLEDLLRNQVDIDID